MRSRSLVLVATSLVAMLAIATVVSAGGMPEGVPGTSGGPGMPEGAGEGMGYHGDMDQEGIQQMLRTGKEIGLMAQMNYQQGMADGGFVSFDLDEENATLTDYTYLLDGNMTFFDSIGISLDDPEVSSQGAVLMLDWDEAKAIVHDNPTAMFHMVVNDTEATVSFLLAEGINWTEVPVTCPSGCDVTSLILYNEGIEAAFMSDGEVDIVEDENGTTITVSLSEQHVMFRISPAPSYQNQLVHQAVLRDQVGAEVSLMVRDGNAAYNVMCYRYGLGLQVMKAEEDKLRFRINSENHVGQVMIVNLEKGAMDMDRDRLRVQIDGEGVGCASVTEVLDGGNASYAVIEGDEVDQLLVHVPDVSSSILEVESVSPWEDILGTEGGLAIAGAAIIVVAAVLIIKRR